LHFPVKPHLQILFSENVLLLREEKLQSMQGSLERFVESKSEEIKKQDEKRQQNADKNLPGVS
jgi:hypothetical protein